MTSEQWTLVKSVFASALEIDPQVRDEWLRSQSKLPLTVMLEVQRLLAASTDINSLVPSSFYDKSGPKLASVLDGVLLDRFELRSQLGSGAMGNVYYAFDRRIGEAVAVKTIKPHLAERPEFIASLSREVALARRVAHRNVCQIRDLHYEPNPPTGPLLFFTMELLNGRTLAAHLAERAMTVPEALEVAKGIASGLAAIHDCNLVHRDLKPSNVFLVNLDAGHPRAVITDFGLCFDETRRIDETLAEFGPEAVVGTPAYMAPEQLLGKGATKISDVYAFGVLLFEMLTGRLPFEGDTALAIALRRLQQQPPEPRSLIKDLPARWNSTILACLQRDPAKRPGSAPEVIQALAGDTQIVSQPTTRRQLLLGVASTAAAGIGGYAVWHRLSSVKPPNPQARYHLKLAEEFIRQALPTSIRHGISELQSAVAIDPQYAAAWADLADAYCMASTYSAMPSSEALKLASDAARKALALNNRLGKAHAAIAYVLACDLKKWRQAEPAFQRAIALDPDNPAPRSSYAGFLGRACRCQEAVAMAESALKLDPGSLRLSYRLGTELLRAHQFARTRTHMESFVTLHPAEGSGYCLLARANEWLKRFDASRESLQIADRLPDNVSTLSYWATLFAATGRMHAAEHKTELIHQDWIKQKAETNVYLYALGSLTNAGLNRIGDIANVIRTGIQRNDETVLAAASNLYIQPVRNDPTLRPLFRQLDFS